MLLIASVVIIVLLLRLLPLGALPAWVQGKPAPTHQVVGLKEVSTIPQGTTGNMDDTESLPEFPPRPIETFATASAVPPVAPKGKYIPKDDPDYDYITAQDVKPVEMGDAESNKTSDEIIKELFSSLNVPLSPRVYEPEESDNKDEVSANVWDSDNSEDEESDSKCSESEEEVKDTAKVVQDNSQTEKIEKRKTPKKKKEKKKKKKKRRKKEDGGRHKHKKKKKKESNNASENNKLTAGILQDIRIRNQALIEKILGQEEMKKAQTVDDEKKKNKAKSVSPKLIDNPSKSSELDSGKKRKIRSDSDSKYEPQGKHCKTDEIVASESWSPSHLLSCPTNNCHSRSQSKSGTQQRFSKSSSRSPSKQTRHSRSCSRTKSSQHKSRTRSPLMLDRHKRSPKSLSRSVTPKHSKRQRSFELLSRSSSPKPSTKQRSKSRSRRRSRSRSQRKSRSRSQRSGSKFQRSRSRSHRTRSKSRRRSSSKSQRRSRSRSRRSRSLRRSGSLPQRSRSRSQRRQLHSKEICKSPEKGKEKPNKTGEPKSQNVQNIDLSSIPTPGSGPKPQNLPGSMISLESIPLPVPPPANPDPRSIPLPQPLLHPDESLGEELKRVNGIGLDLKTIPVPAPSSDSPVKEQDSSKTKDGIKNKQEDGSDKGKAKMIIIKSLKDSLVFLQAQEEAERRAREMADLQGNNMEEVEEKDDEGNSKNEENKDIQQERKDSMDEGREMVLNVDRDIKVKKKEEVKEKKDESEKRDETGYNKEQKKRENTERRKDEKLDCMDMKKNGEHDDNDTLNGMEEGEIVSDEEDGEVKLHSKSHSKKKSKKDKDRSKEKRKSRKYKEKNKEEKKRGNEKSRSREREKTRSRSKEKHRSRRHSSSRVKDRDYDRRHRRYSRSRSRDRSSRLHRRSYSRSHSRSRSHSGRRQDPMADLRDKMTRKRLLEIARRNAVYLMQNGCLPPSVEQEQLVKIKAGGKSVDELTDFCKQLVASGNYSDVDLSDPSISSGDDNDNPDKPFSNTRHPFSVRDTKPILMNIRNAPMLPTKTNAERLAGQAKLREQFPVSSGSQHRTKGELTSSDGKHQTESCVKLSNLRGQPGGHTQNWRLQPKAITNVHVLESDWVPVPPKEKKEEEDKVFPKSESLAVDISQIVSTRLSAMRKLQDNPHDSEAIKTLHNAQKEMQNWALSKQEPGQFTGTTGAKVLSQEELSAGHQAWARKEQFKEAAPVRPQFGLKMLQKMGWSPGEGLGKNKEGTIEPLMLDVKMDKKGFHAQEEVTPKKQPIPLAKDLADPLQQNTFITSVGKHPVSLLVELCSKNKWSPPDFEMVFDCGPDHKKNFLMKVMVNGQEFKPSVAASTKKMAKANAAAAYLQSLGLYPRDPNNPL
ncbi:uncharacterized protein [Panulirus ornatus]|uniref:uncharacterized protein isoform X4 n=1 Tax=Panulirus ornatus TaxID=150431 RepID=UPI003A8C8150